MSEHWPHDEPDGSRAARGPRRATARRRRALDAVGRHLRRAGIRSLRPVVRGVEHLTLRPWPVRRELIGQLLADPRARERISTELRFHQIARADFDRQTPPDLESIRGFEDCYWLFESGPPNCSLSQLQLDEAADLYHRIVGLDRPRVAELGRYKGGTTLLLAAAGADVLSLDNDADGGQAEYLPALGRALARFGLEEHVEAVMADVLEYEVPDDAFDLVLMHCSPDYDLAWAVFRGWWPAVKPGGAFVFHLSPALPGEVRMVNELQHDPRWTDVEFEPRMHGENLVARKIGGGPSNRHRGQ